MNLPDLMRARGSWLTPQRLLVGGVVATAVGAFAALMSVGAKAGGLLSVWVLLLQSFILFFYGVPAAVNDFVEEHRNNTWDMLRLTPLTGFEMVVGRLVASTSYAVFLAAALAPWALFAQSLDATAPGYAWLAALWATLAIGFAASATLGMAAAALAARVQKGRVGYAGMAIGGLGILVTDYTMTMYSSAKTVNLLVGTVSAFTALSALLAFAAIWGAVGAVRTMGRLLSERQTPWALPALMTSLWGILALWVPAGRGSEVQSALCITAPALVAVLASFAEGEGREDWKANHRLATRRRDWGALAPKWSSAWLTVALLAGLTSAFRPESARIAAMVVCFLARDLFLIGILRTVLRRNVEAAAVTLLGALYILPILFAVSLDQVGSLHWMVPMEAAKTGFLANILPSVAHATAAGALFWARVRGIKKEGTLLR